jgi:hypothetical protein
MALILWEIISFNEDEKVYSCSKDTQDFISTRIQTLNLIYFSASVKWTNFFEVSKRFFVRLKFFWQTSFQIILRDLKTYLVFNCYEFSIASLNLLLFKFSIQFRKCKIKFRNQNENQLKLWYITLKSICYE